jgi:hypothetical protein
MPFQEEAGLMQLCRGCSRYPRQIHLSIGGTAVKDDKKSPRREDPSRSGICSRRFAAVVEQAMAAA